MVSYKKSRKIKESRKVQIWQIVTVLFMRLEKSFMKVKKTIINMIMSVIILIAVAGIITILVAGYLSNIKSNGNSSVNANGNYNRTTSKEDIAAPGDGYTAETVYNGYPHLSKALFEIPFKKTENYKSNLELMSDTMTPDEAKELIKSSKTCVNNIFNISTNSVDIQRDNIYQSLSSNFVLEHNGTEYYGTGKAADELNRIFVESCITMESEYISDKCLVYYDENQLIVRGILYFTVYEGTDLGPLESLMNIDNIELGKEYSVIIETYMMSDEYYKDYSSYKVNQIDIMDGD